MSEPATAAAPAEWSRLHPLTILRELGKVAWALIGVYVFDVSVPGIPEEFDYADSVLAVGVFLYAVVRYLFMGYRLTDRALELRTGVLFKQHRSMPRDRVQSVGINTGLVGRFLGVSSLEVSAADTAQIGLSYVSHAEADRLRHLLDPGDAATGDDAEPVEPAEIARMDRRSVWIYSLTDTSAILLVAAPAAAAALIVGGRPVLAAPVMLTILWPVLNAISVVGFVSWTEADRLRVSRGWLERRETDAPLPRIQSTRVSRPPLRRAIGLETLGVATGEAGGSLDDALSDGLLAPLVPHGGWHHLAEQVLGSVATREEDLRSHSPLAVRRIAVRGVALSMVLAGFAWIGLSAFDMTPLAALAILAIGTGLSWAYARVRWKRLGWVADADHLLVRRGVVTQTLTVVPLGKVQDVAIRATVFQRRLGLASLIVDTAGTAAGGTVQVVDLERADAVGLAAHLARSAASVALPDGV